MKNKAEIVHRQKNLVLDNLKAKNRKALKLQGPYSAHQDEKARADPKTDCRLVLTK